MNAHDPHAGSSVLTRGPRPEQAAATLVMLHGRGASAESILSLCKVFDLPDVAAVAPQAAGGTWYPHSFLSPIASNEPYLSSALRRVETTIDDLLQRGVSADRIALLGFSQGACLCSEFLATHPRRYGAAMLLTGGLIGPPGTPRDYAGSLDKTPVLLGTSEPDPHVPIERVLETQSVLQRLGGQVDLRRYPGMPHTINQDEVEACRALLMALQNG